MNASFKHTKNLIGFTHILRLQKRPTPKVPTSCNSIQRDVLYPTQFYNPDNDGSDCL